MLGDDRLAHMAGVNRQEAVATLDGFLDAGGEDGRIQPLLAVGRHRRATPQAGKVAVGCVERPAGAGGFALDIGYVNAEITGPFQVIA